MRKLLWYEIGGPDGNYSVYNDGTREKHDPSKPKAETIWPVTILPARYNGGYEGGKRWLAFNCEYWNVPNEVYGDDISCSTFFEMYERMSPKQRQKNPLKIGRGDTPDEALKDLVAQYYGVS